MVEVSAAVIHSRACIATAEQVRALFETPPPTTEKVAAHAFFCRCIDHFRAAALLAEEGLDAEALVLVRGIVETTFVIGALLTGVISTEEMEAFDRAARARNARAQDDFLRRNAPAELQQRVREYAERNAGPLLKFREVAERIDATDLYDGHYRLFSHISAHPSMSSVAKYLDYGKDRTRIRYPGAGRQERPTMLIASTLFMHTCAAIEHWIGTTPGINQAIRARLEEIESLGSVSDRS